MRRLGVCCEREKPGGSAKGDKSPESESHCFSHAHKGSHPIPPTPQQRRTTEWRLNKRWNPCPVFPFCVHLISALSLERHHGPAAGRGAIAAHKIACRVRPSSDRLILQCNIKLRVTD